MTKIFLQLVGLLVVVILYLMTRRERKKLEKELKKYGDILE